MENKYKYIWMDDVSMFEQYKHKKTKTFHILNNKTNDLLGIILWDSRWRRYVFKTHTLYECIFSTDCHDDIKDFINKLMEERK